MQRAFKMAENMKMEDEERTSAEVPAEEMEQDIQSSDEDDNEEEEEEEDREKIDDPEVHKLELEVQANPYKYDSHVNLINLLRLSGDLDKTREARENMSQLFPLTEELWLQWIKDEIPLACIPEHRKTIISLFEKGVQDYQSIKLWTEYCQFIMDNMEGDDGLSNVRDVFEKAITAAGLHVTEGSSIWDGYRDFEMAILDSFEQMLTDENKDSMEEKIASQKERVKSLFKRQLAIPLLGMQGTMRDFEDWLDNDEDITEAVQQEHEKAVAKLEEVLSYEDALASAEPPRLTEYRTYLEYELKKAVPVRIQCLYERALKENCLVGDLWIEYTGYLDSKLKMPTIAIPAYERALRNCPWVSILWQNYMKALERSNADGTKIKDTLDKALTCGFTNNQDYLQLWHCYCSFLRRQVQEWNNESQQVKDLREAFQSAVGYMQHYFGKDGDSSSILSRYWARIEAFKMNNLEEAQRLWDQIMTGHARELQYWLEYANLARSCQCLPLCRKILQRAVQSASEDPEGATQALLSFEDEEGTLEEWDASYARCHTRLTIVNERRARAAEKEATKEAAQTSTKKPTPDKRKQTKTTKKETKKDTKKARQQNLKRKIKDDPETPQGVKDDTNEPAFKRPHVEGEVKGSVQENKNVTGQEATTQEATTQETTTQETTTQEQHKYERSSDPNKIFVSNLLFSINEEKLKAKFSVVGEVVDVRIVKNKVGKSKGYAYVEFKDKSPVPAALALDRSNMEGRPMFVSPCVDKTKTPTTFKFATSLDKKTLFVSNLPFETKESEVEAAFNKHGQVKQVRLVTTRAGKPKGYGYVEYEDENCASKAVMAMDGFVLNDRTISVALSNPPSRKPTHPEPAFIPPPPPGSRGRSKTQLMLVPRALQKKTTTTSSTSITLQATSSDEKKGEFISEETGKEDKKGFSNDYFRQLMQKK